jgi:renalase
MVERASCLIVGAGLAGLTAAGILQSRGWRVTLLDKGRSPGGRMATRRIGASVFDHGAQFFTVRDARFAAAVAAWEARDWVSTWFVEGGHARYRAKGGMNALAKHLAANLDVRVEVKVESVDALGKGWTVAGLSADALLLTPPAPQTLSLLPAGLVEELKEIGFDACWVLLVTLEGASRVPAPGYVRPEDGPIEWIADNTQKGVSRGSGALTIHARADFSREHFDAEKEVVAGLLLEAARPWLMGEVSQWQVHRWRYSKPTGVRSAPCLFFQTPAPLAIAGDAFGGSRLEGAFLSGVAAADALSLNLNQ